MSAANDQAQPMSRDECAGDWCARLAAGRLERDEELAFEAWLEADPGNAAAYDKALSVWHGLQAIGDAPELIAHRADALEAFRAAHERRWSRPGSLRWGRWAALAAILLLLVTASVWLLGVGQATEYATGLGERRTAMLEDGSRLSLDANSAVSVDYGEGRRALRLLSGRARFDVAHDAARPFTVSAGGRTVVATGTSFSVEMVGGQLHVIVYEGQVAVSRGALDDALAAAVARRVTGTAATTLAPGRELVAALDGQSAPQVRSDVGRSLSWEGGQLDFVDEPLSSAIERLNRYSRDQVNVADPRAGAIAINGVFNAGDTAAFLEAVSAAYPVEIRREGEGMVIRSRSH